MRVFFGKLVQAIVFVDITSIHISSFVQGTVIFNFNTVITFFVEVIVANSIVKDVYLKMYLKMYLNFFIPVF